MVTGDELREAVAAYAGKLAAKSPLALARALESVIAGGEIPQSEAARFESALFGLCFATEDMREGLKAFLDKRVAEFKNR